MTDASEIEELTTQFHEDMRRGIIELAKLGYDASLFRAMVAEHGAVEAVRRLALARVPSYGLWRLRQLRKLDVSVEMWVLLPWYEPLFDANVRQQAHNKLQLLGVNVSVELDRLVTRLGHLRSNLNGAL